MTADTENLLQLRFGSDALWHVPAGEHIASYLTGNTDVMDDIESALEQALSHPREFPSLDQAVVPGDQLVLAVDPSVPALERLLPNLVTWFAERGTPPANIQVVVGSDVQTALEPLGKALASQFGSAIRLEAHDPDDSKALAYVAANDQSLPIYVNRTVVDADVVLPVSTCSSSGGLTNFGAGGIFSQLTDRSTRSQLYRWQSLQSDESRSILRSWADQAARWTGFLMALQVVPAGDDRIASLHAGELAATHDAAQAAADQAWATDCEASELVIALVDGGWSQQSWLAMAQALYAAGCRASEQATLVVCTQNQDRPGPSLQRLRNNKADDDGLLRSLAEDAGDDALPAGLIHHLTQQHHVYLVSGVEREVVESLGLGVLDNEAELNRLMQQFDSAVILGSAQYRGV